MATRPIGSLQVSVLGLGCTNLGMLCDEEQSTAVVHPALDAGVVTMSSARPDAERVDVLVGDNQILELGNHLDASGATFIDMTDPILLPGSSTPTCTRGSRPCGASASASTGRSNT